MVTLDIVAEREDGLIVMNTPPKQDSKSHNGRVIIIEGIAYKISCPRFKECIGPTYNPGLTKFLCSNEHHNLCPTENPEVCNHENYSSPGYPAKDYSKNRGNI